MSSEHLASAQNLLKGNLAGAWDILSGAQGQYTDLGIARRFGGAAAAYSLRDIGAMNGRVVKVRRNNDSTEEDFSANQVQAGVLEDFCDNVLTVGTAVNGTGSFNNYTFTANGNTGFDADNSGGGTGSAGFPYSFKNGDVMTVTYTVTNFSSTSGLSPQIRGTNATSSVTSVASGGTTFTANGTYTDTLTATADGTHLMFADGNTGSYTISNFAVTSHKTDGFVETWYDQSGNGRDATQGTAAAQPVIVQNGLLNTDGVDFDGSNDSLDITNSLPITGSNARSVFAVVNKDVSSSGDNIFGIGDNTNNVNSQLWNLASTYGLYYNGGNTVFGSGSLNTEQLITAIYPSTATDSGDTVFFIDGSSSSITSSADTTLATDNTVSRIGKGGGSLSGVYDGSIQELIVFDSDKLSDRTDIEQDIKNFYNI